MFIEKRSFNNSRGLTLAAIYEGEDRRAPTVVICHGFNSSKESVSQTDLRRRLVNAGFCVFTFDFTGCGESEGQLKDLIPSAGLDDLKSAVADLGKEDFALHGTSFGGYVSLLYASHNPVLALSLKCPVSDYPAVIEHQENREEKLKTIEDTKNNDLYREAKNILAPTLIVHGDADDVVPLDQSKKLLENLGSEEKELKILKGAPHTMRDKPMEQAHREIVNFFSKTLLN